MEIPVPCADHSAISIQLMKRPAQLHLIPDEFYPATRPVSTEWTVPIWFIRWDIILPTLSLTPVQQATYVPAVCG